MATKTITGSYPSGYALNPAYQTLDIASSASVGGTGVTTSATQVSTIDNLGKIGAGSNNGISLADGGTIVNGSSSNSSASIVGIHAIVASKTGTSVTNYGSIASSPVYNYQYPDHYVSIELQAGGLVTNQAGGSIANGISITGGSGYVVNHGNIGDPVKYELAGFGPMGIPEYYPSFGAAVDLEGGGVVINGSSTNTSAKMGGISISGASGSVTNYGSIGLYGAAPGGVSMSAGGMVVNGSSSNTSAFVESVTIVGGYGNVSNYGSTDAISLSTGKATNSGSVSSTGISISGSGNVTNTGSVSSYFDGVDLGSGMITNGSASVTTASIKGGRNGVTVTGAASTLTNFGSIASSKTTGAYQGVKMTAGGTLVNGTTKDTGASISGVVGIEFDGAGTITNYGVIKGVGGTAVSLGSNKATLVENASGTIAGDIVGGGGKLVFASGSGTSSFSNAISGFGSVQIQNGSTVALSGTTNIGSGSTFTNAGQLTNSGTLTLAGQTVNSGSITNASAGKLIFNGDVSITTDPSTKTGQISNAGLIEKTAGNGTSIIRTGNGTLTDTGTIQIDTGTLDLTGASILVSGAIKGAGTVEFGAGSTTLSSTSVTTGGVLLAGSGAHLTLAKSLSYAGTFTQGASTEMTIGNALTLTLTGPASFTRGTIDGQGILNTTGVSTIAGETVSATASWTNSGTVAETGQLTLSTSRVHGFTNAKGAVFDLVGNVGINATTTTRFYNLGLLAKTTGGSSVVAAAITNGGTIEAGSGTLDLQGAITGIGKLQIDSGKTLELESAVASGQTVVFQGDSDRLILTNAPDFAGKLSGFGGADKLDLTQFGSNSSLSYAAAANGKSGTLTVRNGSLVANLALIGSYVAAGFSQASDGKGGDLIGYKASAAATGTTHPAASHESLANALFEAAFAGGGIIGSAVGVEHSGPADAIIAATSAVTPKTPL